MNRVLKHMMVAGAALSLFLPVAILAVGESLCAVVKIEILQELTIERQAFDARMKINNGLENVALENVDVEVNFADADGNVVFATSDPENTNALFFIRLDRMDGISDVAGHGTVAQSSSSEIHWMIIPAKGAGGLTSAGVQYLVGATLNYTLGGQPQTMDVVPDTIYVKPMPSLTLDYFLPHDVYGDDAFTAPIEPVVPFSLGVRVNNAGPGIAGNVKIDTGQLKIVENELGLLIGFVITGSEVNGLPAADSLLVDFGDIGPLAAGTARWIMECSLSGRFTEFTAEFSHADELGGRLTSLIDAEGIRTHELVHDVLVDLPGRDGIRDFLARDGDALHVYESDNEDAPVTDVSGASSLEILEWSTGGSRRLLQAPLTAGPLYVALPVTKSDYVDVISVWRSDGKAIDPVNVWLWKTRESGADPWSHYLSLFDVDGGGGYEIVLQDASGSHQPVLSYVSDKATRIGDPFGLGFLVEASDPDGTIPILTAAPLPFGSDFTVVTNDAVAEGTFFWRPTAGQAGIYGLRFTASDGVLFAEACIGITVVGDEPIINLKAPLPSQLWMEVNGVPGTTYEVEYRTNLVTGTWQNLDTITLPAGEVMLPLDLSEVDEEMLFLRVREQ